MYQRLFELQSQWAQINYHCTVKPIYRIKLVVVKMGRELRKQKYRETPHAWYHPGLLFRNLCAIHVL